MTTLHYRGDAPAFSKVVAIPRPIHYQEGGIVIKINNKKVEHTEWDAAVLVDLWNNAGYPETIPITASVVSDEAGAYGFGAGTLLLTGTPGEDFFVDVEIGGSGVTNEMQKISFDPVPSGGTFTLEFSGQTTGAITFVPNDPGTVQDNIKAALEALSNIAPGDIVVTATRRNNYNAQLGTAYNVQFIGAYLNVDVPLMVANGANLTGGNVTSISLTSRQGVLSINEIQILALVSHPIAGTFTLTFQGQTTAPILYNASAATVQTALAALSTIGAGNVSCSGGPLPDASINITFIQALAGQDLPIITGNGSGLIGGTSNLSNFSTSRNGSTPTNNKLRTGFISFDPVVSNRDAYWQTYGQTNQLLQQGSTRLTPASTNAEVKAALVGMQCYIPVPSTAPAYSGYRLYTIQDSDINVTGSLSDKLVISGNTSSGGIEVEFTGNFAGKTIPLARDAHAISLAQKVSSSGNSIYQQYGAHSQTAVEKYEIQSYTVVDVNLQGNYQLSVYDKAGVSHLTPPIDYNATYVTVVTAIAAALGDIYVSVASSTISSSSITYTLSYGYLGYQGTNITQCANGGENQGQQGVSVIEFVKGDPGVNEIQSILFSNPGVDLIFGGTFTLNFNGQTTTPIAYNATSIQIQLALEALSNIAPGDVAVSGSIAELALQFIWSASLGNVQQIEADPTNLANAHVEVDEYIQGGLVFFFEEVERCRGPQCFDDPKNWSPAQVPSHLDTLRFEYGEDACLWGIKQRDTFTVISVLKNLCQLDSKRPLFQDGQRLLLTSSTTAPAGLTAGTTYFIKNMDERGRFQLSSTLNGSAIDITDVGTGTHTLGLKLTELRKVARYSHSIGLKLINDLGYNEYRPRYLEVYSTAIYLGEGDGSDSSLVRIDTRSQAVTLTVYGTGSSSEADTPAAVVLINEASSDIVAFGGTIGTSMALNEQAVLDTILLHNTELTSIGGTNCTSIQGDGSSIKGKFTVSGDILLNL